MEKQLLSFEKEEEGIKWDNSGVAFVAPDKEEKARSVQEYISALMKRHGAEIRDAVDAAAKEARAGFTKVVNAAV